jgi:hypothetical protein
MKCVIIPVVHGASGIVTEVLEKNVEAVPGKHSINSVHEQPYFEGHTRNIQYCSLKLEA